MTSRAQGLLREALTLPIDERASVAAELLASLDDEAVESPTEVEAAWAEEIEKRARRVMAGESQGVAWEDVRVAAFRKLLEAGHTLIVIEHNMDVIKVADWIIDLGPEGGEDGGRVLAMATPEQVAHVPGSHTGKYIKEVLSSGKLLQTVAR